MEADKIIKTRGKKGKDASPSDANEPQDQGNNEGKQNLIGKFQSDLAQTISLVESMDEETRIQAIQTLQSLISNSPVIKNTPISTGSESTSASTSQTPQSTRRSTRLGRVKKEVDKSADGFENSQGQEDSEVEAESDSFSQPEVATPSGAGDMKDCNVVVKKRPTNNSCESEDGDSNLAAGDANIAEGGDMMYVLEQEGKEILVTVSSSPSEAARNEVDRKKKPAPKAVQIKEEIESWDTDDIIAEKASSQEVTSQNEVATSPPRRTLRKRCRKHEEEDRVDSDPDYAEEEEMQEQSDDDIEDDVTPRTRHARKKRRPCSPLVKQEHIESEEETYGRQKKPYKPDKAVLDFLRRHKKTIKQEREEQQVEQLEQAELVEQDEEMEAESEEMAGEGQVLDRVGVIEYAVPDGVNYKEYDPGQPDVDERKRICRSGHWLLSVKINGSNGWLCKSCNEMFQYRAQALIHLRKHTGERPFKCRFCDQAFTFQANMFRHCRDVHERDPLPCTQCDAEFENRKDLKQHMLQEHNVKYEKEYICKYCNLRCHSRIEHKDHVKNVHPEHREKFQCTYCSKVFHHVPNLQRHLKWHAGDKPHKCHLCDAAYIERRGLRHHLISSHSDDPEAKLLYDVSQKFPCIICGKEFLTKANLTTHEITHTGEKPFACSYCTKRFNIKSNLVRHERIHRGEKPYQCPDCGKSFTEKRSMIVHRRLHTGEKPHRCEICGKCFRQLGSLTTHMPVHTKDRSFRCDQCPSTFLRRAHLTAHMRKHRGNPYPATQRKSNTIKEVTHLQGSPQYNPITSITPYQETSKEMPEEEETIGVVVNSQGTSRVVISTQFEATPQPEGSLQAKKTPRVRATPKVKPSPLPKVSCPNCGECFHRKSDLKRHLETHEQVFECELCQKRFERLEDINRHILNDHQTGEEAQVFATEGDEQEVKMELGELATMSENELAAQGIISLSNSTIANIPITMETNQNCTSLVMEANEDISDTLVEDIQRALAQEGASGEWQIVGAPQGNGVHEYRLERVVKADVQTEDASIAESSTSVENNVFVVYE